MQPPDGGAGNDNPDFPDGDPWHYIGGDDRAGTDGWSWTNNEKASRRRCGKRGSGGGGKLAQQPRWRSGQVPQPPEFDGGVAYKLTVKMKPRHILHEKTQRFLRARRGGHVHVT